MPDEVKLKPGEHRVVRTQPCPPHMYTHPNGYWFLKRVARHFLQDEFNLIWDNDGYFESALVTLRKLRETAKLFSATPWKKWEQERMGEVQEICCPACSTVFEWEGYFYVPQCPGCKWWLRD